MFSSARLSVVTSGIAILLMALAGSVQAQTLPFAGEWFENRGPLVDIPVAGGPGPCVGGANTGCLGNLKPIIGGVQGAGTANIVGSAPAGFTLPTQAFNWKARPGGDQVALPINATVIQFDSFFTLAGPGGVGAVASLTSMNAPAKFMANAWNLDPGQTGRAAASFTWCPVAGGPACAVPTPPTGTQFNGLVRYAGGTNNFGGTMTMLLTGGATVSVIVGTTGGTAMIPLVGHNPVGGVPGFAGQHPGRGYASFDTDMILSGPVHAGFVTGPPCTQALPPKPNGCGLILGQGPQVAVIPAATNYNWGFPWTTGMVTVQNIETNMGQPATTTLTAQGTDSRTALGSGNITLVAGGTAWREPFKQAFANLDIVTITMGADAVLPVTSPAGAVAAALLLMLTGGFVMRHRFAKATE
jgi:hypothetical protein